MKVTKMKFKDAPIGARFISFKDLTNNNPIKIGPGHAVNTNDYVISYQGTHDQEVFIYVIELDKDGSN